MVKSTVYCTWGNVGQLEYTLSAALTCSSERMSKDPKSTPAPLFQKTTSNKQQAREETTQTRRYIQTRQGEIRHGKGTPVPSEFRRWVKEHG